MLWLGGNDVSIYIAYTGQSFVRNGEIGEE